MEAIDFSVPRRMGGTALIIIFIKNVRQYIGLFFIFIVSLAWNERGFSDRLIELGVIIGAPLLWAFITSLISYRYKLYQIKDGQLVFKHGFWKRETTNIPLDKVHSLRTKRGFLYRIFGLRGVSFDTLAMQMEEVELILDEHAWRALLSHIQHEESRAVPPAMDEEKGEKDYKFSNLNLVKGAFCQNHLRGLAVMLGVVFWVWDKVMDIDEDTAQRAFDYVGSRADEAVITAVDVIVVAAIVYLLSMLVWVGIAFFRYYNMRVRIDSDQLTFSKGLISRSSARFSYDKVCAVYVKRNPLERLLRCCTVMLMQARNATTDMSGSDVKIFGSQSSGLFLTWWLGEGYASESVIAEAKSGRGVVFHSVKLGWALALIVIGLLVYYGEYAWVWLPAACMAIALVRGFLACAKSRITLRKTYIDVSNGAFADVNNYVKYADVQAVELVRSPVAPITHRATLVFVTNGTAYKVRSLAERDAALIYELLLSNQR